MKLSFNSVYNSIKDFPDIELPKLVLITGLNGSGKSHLLEALTQGKILADLAPNYTTEIRLFTTNQMIPADSAGFFSGQLAQEREGLLQEYLRVSPPYKDNLRQNARNYGITGTVLNDLEKLISLSPGEVFQINKNQETADRYAADVHNLVNQAGTNILNNIQHAPYRAELEEISRRVEKPIALLNKEDFKPTKSPSWGRTQPFQQEFGRLFVQYAELEKSNVLAKAYCEPHLSDEKFREKYMAPPWEFVNDALANAGLHFVINRPDKIENSVFIPRLTKILTGDELPFANLSSGEKIIMSFALCLYYANEGRQLTTYPKLLLLDEIDAYLHPSMVSHFLKTITDVLVKQNGVQVIATTHSPTTVALAPDESVYVMTAGVAGLKQSTKNEALNMLTVGVPTLALEFEGRRQVFVESSRDVELYEIMYEILKSYVSGGRSLHFIGSGLTEKTTRQDTNTGKEIVKSIVTNLAQNGNKSTFGIIDWDLKNSSSNRIFVLAEGERYAIENVVLDPIAIGALVCKDSRMRHYFSKLGFADGLTFVKFCNSSPSELQDYSDKICNFLYAGNVGEDKKECEYFGGFKLKIPTVYIEARCHELESEILAKLPELRKFYPNLKKSVVLEIFREQPNYISRTVLNVFKEIAAKDAH